MSTASRRLRLARQDESIVSRLYADVSALSRHSLTPAPDATMNRLLERIYDATARLVGAPSASPPDLVAKLTILCARLREDAHPEHRGELLNYLLAESIRDDCRVLLNLDPAGYDRSGQ